MTKRIGGTAQSTGRMKNSSLAAVLLTSPKTSADNSSATIVAKSQHRGNRISKKAFSEHLLIEEGQLPPQNQTMRVAQHTPMIAGVTPKTQSQFRYSKNGYTTSRPAAVPPLFPENNMRGTQERFFKFNLKSTTTSGLATPKVKGALVKHSRRSSAFRAG